MNSLSQHSNKELSDLSDEQLMLGFSDGDMAAFESLYERHKGSLYRFFLRQSNHGRFDEGVSVDDLFQELWSRVIKASSDYRADAKWTTWVYRVATNLVIDHKRAMKPLSSLSLVVDAGSPDQNGSDSMDQYSQSIMPELHDDSSLPEKRLQQHRLAQRLKLCIARLPGAQQQVFLLSEETGLTSKEIASVVDASLEAIKSRMRYARQQLQQCLDKFTEGKG